MNRPLLKELKKLYNQSLLTGHPSGIHKDWTNSLEANCQYYNHLTLAGAL
jgi:hypothetical protein